MLWALTAPFASEDICNYTAISSSSLGGFLLLMRLLWRLPLLFFFCLHLLPSFRLCALHTDLTLCRCRCACTDVYDDRDHTIRSEAGGEVGGGWGLTLYRSEKWKLLFCSYLQFNFNIANQVPLLVLVIQRQSGKALPPLAPLPRQWPLHLLHQDSFFIIYAQLHSLLDMSPVTVFFLSQDPCNRSHVRNVRFMPNPKGGC